MRPCAMNEAQRAVLLSYGQKAVTQEFGPHGAALVHAGVAPAGAVAFKGPVALAALDQRTWLPIHGDQFKYAMQVVDGPGDKPAPIPTGVRVGADPGYPRLAVDACVARMRAASPYAAAAAILRTEPFASAPQLVAGVRGGEPLYTGVVNPWDWWRLADASAVWAPGERARLAIGVARHYAAGIQDGSARPRNLSPTWGDRIVERLPTHDRTAAWVDAWARWALDAVVVALNDPATYGAVAGGVLSICRGWDPVILRGA